MIEVQHLTKRYGDLTAVSEVSFSVASGQILGFLGPNGSGKTTTMRIITGFLPATSGTVKVAGFDIFDDSFEVRKRIEDVLKKTDSAMPRGEALRTLRAIETLELLGTPEAKAVLQTLANGMPQASVTRAAQAALLRLR